MTEFVSLFEEPGAAVEAEAAERRMANAKVASATVGNYLLGASDPVEFGQRLDLVQADLVRVASATGVEVTDLAGEYQRQHGLLVTARKQATRKQATAECACGHSSLHHADGGRCPTCGCEQFRAVAQAAKDPNAYLDHMCPGCGRPGNFSGPENSCPSCAKDAADYADRNRPDDDRWQDDDTDDRTAYERYGDSGPSYRDAGDDQDDWYGGHYSSLKTALEEGQDPIAWLEGAAPGLGTPEKPGGHTETNEASEAPSAAQQAQATRQRPRGRNPFAVAP
jgi:hypothetical protein